MNFVEFLGFIISLGAMIFLFTKRFLEDRKRRLNPEEYARKEKEQEENLRRFYKSISGDFDDEEKEEEDEPVSKTVHQPLIQRRPPPKPPKPTIHRESYVKQTATEKKKSLAHDTSGYTHTVKPAERYEVIRSEKISKTSQVLNHLKSPKDLLIIKEIFDKPLSMRDRE
jgi:hypothetical protein